MWIGLGVAIIVIIMALYLVTKYQHSVRPTPAAETSSPLSRPLRRPKKHLKRPNHAQVQPLPVATPPTATRWFFYTFRLLLNQGIYIYEWK